MKMWEPKSCCFCFDAKNGSLIIGSVFLIEAIYFMVMSVLGQVALFIKNVGMNTLPSCVNDPLGDLCAEQLTRTVFLIELSVMLVYFISAIVCAMLIHGIRKKRHLLMLPFVAFLLARMTFELCIVGAATYVKISGPGLNWPSFVIEMTGLLVKVLFLLPIRSHYRDIKQESLGVYNKLQECEITA